jgi:O-antigen/teichoic acid export membrane protein
MKKVWKNLVSVVGGEAAVRAANFIAALFIARAYGRETLGAYAACLAVVTVVVMFADNGLQTSAITQLSSADASRNQIIGQLAISKAILLGAATIVLAGIGAWMKLSSLFWTVGAWVALRTVLQSYSQLQLSILKVISKANSIGAIQCIHSGLLFVVIGLAFTRGWGVFTLLAGMTLCQAFELALGGFVAQRAGLRPSWPERLQFWHSMRKSTPFGITYGLATLIIRSDTIVLSALVSLSDLGSFSAANTVLLFVYVSSWLMGSILLPEMVRLSGNPENLKMRVDKLARLVAAVMVPSAAVASLVAPQLITTLFGRAFTSSGAIASVMALACPFVVLNSVYTSLAIALNRRAVFVGVFAATAFAAIAMDYSFGRAFGARGVAWAIVLREAGMLFGFLILMSREAVAGAAQRVRVSPARNQEQFSERV